MKFLLLIIILVFFISRVFNRREEND